MDKFYTVKKCERCGNTLKARCMSWFTEEIICTDCDEKEGEIKRKLREQGKDTRTYEGCGYIPQI